MSTPGLKRYKLDVYSSNRSGEFETYADMNQSEHGEYVKFSDVEHLIEALKFYADKNNWRDLWKDGGKESDSFKYFYRLGTSTDDMYNLSKDGDYHYCMGKRAKEALSKLEMGE